MKDFVKFLIFVLTPHLIFDLFKYHLTKKDANLADEIKSTKNVFVFLGCDYANLGDYAITIAQKKMLCKLFPNRVVHVINMNNTYAALKTVIENKNNEDVITLIGGGNMGEMYYGYERKRNLIVKMLPNNRIISFPQTISFSNTHLGRLALRRSVRTYSKHSNLTILAREKMSFDIMQKLFPKNKVELTPDVVMTLDYKCSENRSGVVLSLRKDKESVLSESNRQSINIYAQSVGSVTVCDTCPKTEKQLDDDLTMLLSSYAKSKLVITDRLHGMIFAYITGTPAVVFLNSNGKILHCYDWIEKCGYIKLVPGNDVDSLESVVKNFDLKKEYYCDNEKLTRYFDKLGEVV